MLRSMALPYLRKKPTRPLAWLRPEAICALSGTESAPPLSCLVRQLKAAPRASREKAGPVIDNTALILHR